MKNAETIRRRIDEAKKISETDPSKAIALLAEVSYDIGIDACDERSELKREVEKLRRFIIGNGDPTNSIMARLKGLENSVDELSCSIGEDIKEIKFALLGDIKGDKKGLYDKVSDNTRINQNLNRIVWAVILIVVGELVARLLGLF
jgi:predicted phage-related endonuclease